MFKTMVSEFKSLCEKLGDENEAYVLINSLLKSYREVKSALKYSRESITTNSIISALKTREIELQTTKKDQTSGAGLFVKAKPNSNH